MATKWRVYEKHHPAGKYQKYYDKVVIITSSERGFLVSPAAAELLGDPKRALLLNDGNGNMGIRPVKEDDPQWHNAYSFVTSSGSNPETSMRQINCKTYIREYNVNTKAVFSTISIENGIMVVDLTKFEPLNIRN